MLILTYDSRVFSQSASELIQITDQSLFYPFNFNTGGFINPGDSFVTNFTYNYAFIFPSGQVIDSMYLKRGELLLDIVNNFNMPGKIEITLPATRGGVPIKETIYINNPNESKIINFDITKFNLCKLFFNHSGGTNQLEINFRVVLYGNGNPNISPYNIISSISFNNIKFNAIFGYLGQLNFAFNEDTIKIKLYNNNNDGYIYWDDPRLYITAVNYFGMPVRVNINLIDAERTIPPLGSTTITGSGIPVPWDILYPNFSQMGQGVSTEIELNKYNSNIADAYNISPQQINCLLDAGSNFPGFTPYNFAFDTSSFSINVRTELPLHGLAENFVIQDTIEADFGSDFNDNAENIEWVLFKLYAENGFPIDAKIQVYFLDENYIFIDSLLNPFQQFLHAATPGPPPDFLVTQKYKKTITFKIDKNRIKEYGKIRHAVVRANMLTFNNATQIVKIYPHYGVHVMIGLQVQLKF